jgi:hypothetical protein
MCDYSLHDVATRPAKVGDKLVSTMFRNTVTRGFAAVGEPGVAVCLLPGTELAFVDEIAYEHAFKRLLPSLRFGKTRQKVARFRQLNMDQVHVHHDALELANGKTVLLTRLCEGQHATVLQLPAESRAADAADAKEAKSARALHVVE